jgi:ribulose-phosphate 3-epimerase
MKVKIAPSILSADFGKLGSEIEEAQAGGADMIHIDVMDGHFVPNITLGPVVVKNIRGGSSLPFDVHLMISHPRRCAKSFADAGADIITFHIESEDARSDTRGVIDEIKQCGKSAGITLNPSTPLNEVEKWLGEVDMLLVMTVNPGIGGQKFIEETLEKVGEARKMIDDQGYDIDLQVDGGIKPSNARMVVEKGANILVAGSAVFQGEIKSNIRALIRSVEGT